MTGPSGTADAGASALPTFQQVWSDTVDHHGDDPFLVFSDDDDRTTTYTYREMDSVVAEAAARLGDLGVGASDSVHLVLVNSPAFVVTWLACSRLGASMVPADPGATVDELRRQIERVEPRAAVVALDRKDDYRRAAVGSDVSVLSVAPSDTALAELRAPGEPPNPVAITPDTPLGVLFTSGTTAEPKGVVVTQANYAFTGRVMAAAAGLGPEHRQFVALPIYHANAQYYSFASAISVGASVAMVERFSASRFVEQVRRSAATHASLFAAPIRMILARTDPAVPPLELTHCWFAQNLTAVDFDRACQLFGCRPRQLYGMTETIPAVLSNPVGADIPTSIGVPTPGCAVRTAADGTIEVGGVPGATLFAEYLDDPASTAAATVEHRPDGSIWFTTGDRAEVDDQGYYYFTGRDSEILKIGGENVALPEIERALAEHPDVVDVAVVGVADDVYDQVPHAYVVLRPGSSTATSELERFALEKLSRFKRPRSYSIVAELPRTSVGKIRKHALRTDAENRPQFESKPDKGANR